MVYRTTTRFRCHDATIRAGYARSNVPTTWVNQAGSRRTRLGFLFRFFPCRVHALPSTREKDRQTEKRRETNAGYTRRRHLQKLEKQERKRAVFCTIVKSTDGREIDNTASQPRTCVGRNDPRARVHEALSRFIRRLARLRRTASRGMSLKHSHGRNDLQRQLPSTISFGLASDNGYIYPLNRAPYGFSSSQEYLASLDCKWKH